MLGLGLAAMSERATLHLIIHIARAIGNNALTLNKSQSIIYRVTRRCNKRQWQSHQASTNSAGLTSEKARVEKARAAEVKLFGAKLHVSQCDGHLGTPHTRHYVSKRDMMLSWEWGRCHGEIAITSTPAISRTASAKQINDDFCSRSPKFHDTTRYDTSSANTGYIYRPKHHTRRLFRHAAL